MCYSQSVRRCLPGYTFILVVFTSCILFAQTQQKLEHARVALDQRNYPLTIASIEPLINALKLDTLEHILAAYTLLGVAYCQDHQESKAQQAFAYLLSFSPDANIAFAMSKRCWRLFHDIKYPNREKDFTLKKSQIIEKPQDWKNYMPFGVAQYYQNRPKTGAWLLSIETLSTASLITSMILFNQGKNADNSFDDTQNAGVYRAINWGSLAVLGSSILYGFVDGRKHKKTKSTSTQ